MCQVRELTDDLVPIVDAYLRSALFINAFAIWDLHHLRHRAKFLVCIDNGRLRGLLLDYPSYAPASVHFVWLWGEKEAISKLLDTPLPGKVVFHVPPEAEDIVRRKFSITAKCLVDFMLLRKGGGAVTPAA